MSKGGFTLLTTYASGNTKFQDVNVPQLIESQKNILRTTLSDVVEKLKEEEMTHREQFNAKRLADVFPQTLGYYFEKIGEAIHGNKPSEFGAIHVKLVIETIDRFKDALNERGILEAYDSIDYDLSLIGYPLGELRDFFDSPQESKKLNNEDAYIFMYFISKHIDGLIKIAEEIDEEYADEP